MRHWLAIAFVLSCKKDVPDTGVEIVYTLDRSVVIEDAIRGFAIELRDLFAEAKLEASVEATTTTLVVTTANPGSVERIIRDYDLAPQPCPQLCFTLSPSHIDSRVADAKEHIRWVIKERIENAGFDTPTLIPRADGYTVYVPLRDAAQIDRVLDLMVPLGRLELRVVDDGSPFMKRLAARIGQTDPLAHQLGVSVKVDAWTDESTGASHVDYFLQADDTTAIDRYLTQLAADDASYAVPSDRRIAYQQLANRRWRSYYLLDRVELSGSAITEARANTGSVDVELNRYGTQVFGDLTERVTGNKLATLFDGKVVSAPVVTGPIRGGHFEITVDDARRDDLVRLLKSGALPAPLHRQSVVGVGLTYTPRK